MICFIVIYSNLVRSLKSSLSNILLILLRTVPSLRKRLSAISLLEKPSAIFVMSNSLRNTNMV